MKKNCRASRAGGVKHLRGVKSKLKIKQFGLVGAVASGETSELTGSERGD